MAYAARVAASVNDLCGAEWDALVIGAGPAGGVAAATLAGRGMRVVLVDRREFPRQKVCGCCLAPAGAGALRAVGLGGALREAGEVGALRLIAGGAVLRLGIEPYLVMDRSRLDASIAAAAVERGAVFAGGVCARVLRDDAVELSVGNERGVARAGVVVVADGLAGTALRDRTEFAWRVDGRSPVGVGCVLDRRPGHAREGEITMVSGRDGYVGAAPLGEARWALGAALAPGAVRERGPLGAIARVLGESGIEAPALERGALHGVGNLTRHRERVACGRVLVVGDAAGYVQPLTGEGMSWAIACAARIGPFAEFAAAGRDVGASWAAECRRALRGRRAVCRAVCAVAARPALLAAALRVAGAMPGMDWAGRRLCWRAA